MDSGRVGVGGPETGNTAGRLLQEVDRETRGV